MSLYELKAFCFKESNFLLKLHIKDTEATLLNHLLPIILSY